VTRLKVLVFGVVVLGGLIMLGVGWHVGRQARRACESVAREQPATGERQYAVKQCLAARLLSGGA
jgi:F0F1-type ATP synthase membrane subunit c/vacuolar-type H+-ATPase subunit K